MGSGVSGVVVRMREDAPLRAIWGHGSEGPGVEGGMKVKGLSVRKEVFCLNTSLHQGPPRAQTPAPRCRRRSLFSEVIRAPALPEAKLDLFKSQAGTTQAHGLARMLVVFFPVNSDPQAD